MEASRKINSLIPASLSRLFQEYDVTSLDIDAHASIIIERTLEMGTWEELCWLFRTYGVQPIIEYLTRLGHRRLSPVTFNYWRKLLKIEKYQVAPFHEVRKDIWID